MNYRIVWEIDLDASTAHEAAKAALAIQRNPESIATAFDVFDEAGRRTKVDLRDNEQ